MKIEDKEPAEVKVFGNAIRKVGHILSVPMTEYNLQSQGILEIIKL